MLEGPRAEATESRREMPEELQMLGPQLLESSRPATKHVTERACRYSRPSLEPPQAAPSGAGSRGPHLPELQGLSTLKVG